MSVRIDETIFQLYVDHTVLLRLKSSWSKHSGLGILVANVCLWSRFSRDKKPSVWAVEIRISISHPTYIVLRISILIELGIVAYTRPVGSIACSSYYTYVRTYVNRRMVFDRHKMRFSNAFLAPTSPLSSRLPLWAMCGAVIAGVGIIQFPNTHKRFFLLLLHISTPVVLLHSTRSRWTIIAYRHWYLIYLIGSFMHLLVGLYSL